VICAGDSVLLNAGSGFTSYQWNTGATSQTIFAKNSGKYTVITTGNNCSGKDSVTVVVNPLPTPVITGNTTLCFGDSVRLSVAGQFDSVRWSTNQTSFNINVTLGGGYSVKAYKNGCTGTANTTITVQNLSVNITGDSVICAGASAVLQANSGFAHYLWNTNDTTKSLTINTAGVYSLMGTSNEGCKATDTFRVSAISENYFLSSHNESICIGDTAVFFLSRNNNGVITVADTFNFAQTGRHEITYQTTTCGLFKDSVFVNSKPVKKPVISGDTSVCVNQSVTLDAGIGFDTYIWQPTGEQTQGITTNILGTHVVTTTKQGFCKDSSFVTLVHAKSPTPFTLGNDTSFCGEFSKVLTAGNKPVLWNTGEVANQITITKAGEYIAQDSTRCGVIRDTIIIKNNPLPVLKLGSDVEFCDSIQLSAGNKALQSILWNTYDTTYTIIVKNEGMYAVTIMDSNFCKNVDSVFAKKVCDYTIYIPTAFSPNNDGINDIIVPLSKAKGIFILSFQIYNRWGEKVFESADFYPNDIRFGWNGIYKNAECPLDSYVYLLKTQFPDNTYKDYKGIIVLLK
jgi:gliding motility-associated-like protein